MDNNRPADNLRYFWFVLYILGINSYTNSNNFFTKRSIPFFIFVAISVPCFLKMYLNIVLQFRHAYLVVALAILFAAILSMYLLLFRRRKQLGMLRQYIAASSGHHEYRIHALFCTFVLVYLLKSIGSLVLYLIYQPLKLSLFHVCTFNNIILQNVVSTASLIFVVSFLFAVPCFFNYLFLAVCCQWASVISSLKQEVTANVQECFCDPAHAHNATILLKKCRYVWRGATLIEETFSSFALCMISLHIVALFVHAANLAMDLHGMQRDLELYFDFVLSAFHFSVTVYMAARIPEEMEDLLSTLKPAYEELFFKTHPVHFGHVQKQLEVIIRKDPVVLSIRGWASLRKSFILVVFGGLFTYGVVLIKGV